MSKAAAILALLFTVLSGFMAGSSVVSFVEQTEVRMTRIEAVQNPQPHVGLHN